MLTTDLSSDQLTPGYECCKYREDLTIQLYGDSEKPFYQQQIPGTCNSGTAIPMLLPYHSDRNPLKYGNRMGRGGVPLLGVPGITLVCEDQPISTQKIRL